MVCIFTPSLPNDRQSPEVHIYFTCSVTSNVVEEKFCLEKVFLFSFFFPTRIIVDIDNDEDLNPNLKIGENKTAKTSNTENNQVNEPKQRKPNNNKKNTTNILITTYCGMNEVIAFI